jgi:hypothetical protein
VQSANFITPANTLPDNGTRNQMTRSSPEFINYTWPTTTTLGISPPRAFRSVAILLMFTLSLVMAQNLTHKSKNSERILLLWRRV